MIKKLKIGLFVFTVLMFGFLGAQSAYAVAALHWDADTTVTINSNNYTIETDSEATSIVVGATTLTVVVPASSTFTLSSVVGFDLAPDGSDAVEACTGYERSAAYTGSGTVVYTPTDTKMCGSPTGGSGNHSGGGSSTPPVVPPVTPEVTPSEGCSAGNIYNTSTGALCVNNQTLQIPGCGSRTTGFSTATGASCVGNHVTPATPVTGNSYAFGTTVVKTGTKGEACKAWQNFLNDHANAGLVTDGWCGKLTIAKAKLWQASAGLVADGLLGPASRAKANQ